jgi:HAD superfamily hydrolase (TIGR01509 family)
VERLLDAVGGSASLRCDLYQTLGYDPSSDRFATNGPVITASLPHLNIIAATILYQHGYGWLEGYLLVEEHFARGVADTFNPSMLRPLADLPALFGDLSAHSVGVALVTSDDHAPAQQTLEIFGVAHHVGFVVGGDDGFAHKPSPEALLAACERFQVSPQRAVMVGDSSTDMIMAQRAGFGLCVGVLSGPMERSALDGSAHVVLDSIAQIHLVQ